MSAISEIHSTLSSIKQYSYIFHSPPPLSHLFIFSFTVPSICNKNKIIGSNGRKMTLTLTGTLNNTCIYKTIHNMSVPY